MRKAYLILNNGMVFEGKGIGDFKDSVGELVFTTGMVGYLETLTDPSYAGQIVIQTFPLIGNYGVIESDFEGTPALNGYILRECCEVPSNFRSEYELDRFLSEKGIPGICEIDTRRLTRIIREEGVMNAKICSEIPNDYSELDSYTVRGAVEKVSCRERQIYPAETVKKFSVVLIDYGAKLNIIRSLCRRGCEVIVVPYNTSAEEITGLNPDGVMLSNGPGNPEDNTYCIEQISKLIGNIPMFGICLGHQLAALAMGGKTEKLRYGHRGANQPVRDLAGSRTFITSQNHGYSVIADSLKGVGTLRYINMNDGSCEGIDYPGRKCFTVQFHPEACSGPHDTEFLFDRFTELMGGNYNA